MIRTWMGMMKTGYLDISSLNLMTTVGDNYVVFNPRNAAVKPPMQGANAKILHTEKTMFGDYPQDHNIIATWEIIQNMNPSGSGLSKSGIWEIYKWDVPITIVVDRLIQKTTRYMSLFNNSADPTFAEGYYGIFAEPVLGGVKLNPYVYSAEMPTQQYMELIAGKQCPAVGGDIEWIDVSAWYPPPQPEEKKYRYRLLVNGEDTSETITNEVTISKG